MNGNIVTFRDQEGVNGFGAASEEDLGALLKALTAGQSVNAPGSVTSGDGFALRVESLERTLRNTTFRMEHIKLWKTLPKLAAYNTVEEYNQIQEYGQDVDAFIEEGGLPSETDAKYERKTALIKYMGTQRKVSHVMSLIKPAHGNVIAQETVNGTMKLLKSIEKSLFFGDSSLDDIQWDGYKRLIERDSPSANIVDLRGKPLSQDNLIDGSLRVFDAPNFGTPTHLFMNPRVHSDLVKAFFPQARYDLLQKRADGMIGLDFNGWVSPAGPVMFEPDTFIDDEGGQPSVAVGAAPATPVFNVQPAAGAGAGQFTSADYGAYRYAISAVSRGGESAAVQDSAAVTNSSGSPRITMQFSAGVGGETTRYFKIFRTTVGGAAGTGRLIGKVKNTGGTLTFTDNNDRLPGCSVAILFQMNLEAVSFKQLAPMVKIPLATIDTSIRWMQLIYGVPMLYTPGKILMFKNVGRAAGSVA